MVQAKRKKPAKSPKRKADKPTGFGLLSQSFSFLFAGIVIGVLSTLFWQGYQTSHEGDIGSGLKDMIDKSRLSAERQKANHVAPEPIIVDQTPRETADYDFYTVLPAIEEVLPKNSPIEDANAQISNASPKKEATKQDAGNSYFLQVASYQRQADAEQLKAKLALSGLRAAIQNVSIDKKQYYRVRIGPYASYDAMTSDDNRLSTMGFKALRLRVSQG